MTEIINYRRRKPNVKNELMLMELYIIYPSEREANEPDGDQYLDIKRTFRYEIGSVVVESEINMSYYIEEFKDLPNTFERAKNNGNFVLVTEDDSNSTAVVLSYSECRSALNQYKLKINKFLEKINK